MNPASTAIAAVVRAGADLSAEPRRGRPPTHPCLGRRCRLPRLLDAGRLYGSPEKPARRPALGRRRPRVAARSASFGRCSMPKAARYCGRRRPAGPIESTSTLTVSSARPSLRPDERSGPTLTGSPSTVRASCSRSIHRGPGRGPELGHQGVHRVSKAAKVNCRLHDLRHFMATTMLTAGIPITTVSARLSHARTSTTLNVYAHAVPGGDALRLKCLGASCARPVGLPSLKLKSLPHSECRAHQACPRPSPLAGEGSREHHSL